MCPRPWRAINTTVSLLQQKYAQNQIGLMLEIQQQKWDPHQNLPVEPLQKSLHPFQDRLVSVRFTGRWS